MSWWGKVVGGSFGFMLGGPLGAVLGAALGHNFDRGMEQLPGRISFRSGDQERVQMAFFTATFSVMGHIAKADGRVSKEEIALAEAVIAEMDLSEEKRRAAMQLFSEGKADDFPLDEVLEQFRQECHRRQTLIQMFMEIQLQAAYADGHMNVAEERLLLHICQHLGFPEAMFRRLETMIKAHRHATGAGSGGGRVAGKSKEMDLQDAYGILSTSPSATDKDVKRSYRRLMSQHHPDKLVSKGLPEEMMKLASKKTDEIRKAYERVKQDRGM